ncbi:MAG: MG2 domain-containing protein [Nonlabens sp.]
MYLTSRLIVLWLLILLVSCNNNPEPDSIHKYRDYITYTTSGVVSVARPIKIQLARDVELFTAGDQIPDGVVTIQPSIDGKLSMADGNQMIFEPLEPMEPDTEYAVQIKIGDLFKGVSKELENYTFLFKTIEPNFSINTGSIQSYSKDYQYLQGSIETADVTSISNIKQLLKASQNKENLTINWDEFPDRGTRFLFKIDSIKRGDQNGEILIEWNGDAIKADYEGEESIVIPGRDNFTVLGVTKENEQQEYLAINFSDPIKVDQNFAGLVKIENIGEPRYDVDGNVLRVYYNDQLSGDTRITVFPGIQNIDKYSLKTEYDEVLFLEQIKPGIRLLGSGNYLPDSQNLRFNFESVNLSNVDVRIIKIYEDNVLQFLQNNDLDRAANIKRVGRRIALETITLIPEGGHNSKNWKAHSIDLKNYFTADPGAIYRVELSFSKEYSLYDCGNDPTSSGAGITSSYPGSIQNDTGFNETIEEEERERDYWDDKLYEYRNYSYNWRERDDPCSDAYYNRERIMARNVVASNLGVIVKEGSTNNYFFAVNNILSTQPEGGALIRLYNFQQQEIARVSTRADGTVRYDSDREAAFAIVTKNKNSTYIKLNDGNALSLSKYDVSGASTHKGINGFIYTERGVWRPGDTVHLNFMLDDRKNPLPRNYPVKIEVRDPNNQLIHSAVKSDHINRICSFPFTTSTDNITGNYRATIAVGGAKFYKTLKIETVKPNRLKIKLDWGKKNLTSNEDLKGDLQVNWLHGAPASNVRAQVTASFSKVKAKFKGFENYNFTDPTRNFTADEMVVFDDKVSDQGTAELKKTLKLGSRAPGMLKANFLVKAFEAGGDFSIDAFSKPYAPYAVFAGIKSPKKDDYSSYSTGDTHRFDVAAVSDQGQPVSNRDLEVKVFKIEWRWWWNSNGENLSTYNSSKVHTPYQQFTVKTNASGKTNFDLTIPTEDRGRFLVKVADKNGKHATGETMYFYDNWWEDLPSGDKEAAKMLVFNASKDNYKVGEVASLTFPSDNNGKALLTLENGDGIISHRWISTTKGTTTTSIKITESMAPNFFASISLLQPHAQIENDLPIRLYGTIPIVVSDPSKKLLPEIKMPATVEPEKSFEITVTEAQNAAMTYTLAIVEVGLLDLTRFKTPDPYGHFYARQALGVRTWDIYDQVIGAYSGSIDQVYAIGGDGSNEITKNKKANRFKPVIKHLGPFELRAGKQKTHTVKLPNYIGSVRAMVVASNDKEGAYGNTHSTALVKKPLMVLPTLPRKLSPGENVIMPVTIFSGEQSIKDVVLEATSSSGIILKDAEIKNIRFSQTGEQMTYIALEVGTATGIEQVTVKATAGKYTASHTVEIDVVNPNVITTDVSTTTVAANSNADINFKTFGVEGSNSASIEVSTVPPIDFEKRLAYLVNYPHGCLEQTTSAVFPQLFMNDLFDLSSTRSASIQRNIKKAIERINRFQRPNGSLSYWMGEPTTSDWGTTYAGHFMLEAQAQGYALPPGFKASWLRYQARVAREWRPNKTVTNDLPQAYRLYTLALAGSPDLGSMNRLRESRTITNNARWRLAAAYAIIGQEEASRELVNKSILDFKQPGGYPYFGSLQRNMALSLETMVLTGDQRAVELAGEIAKNLSNREWMSTQTTAYNLLAISKMIAANGGKAIDAAALHNGKSYSLKTNKPLITRSLDIKKGNQQISIENKAGNLIYVSTVTKGKLPMGDEKLMSIGLDVRVDYQLNDGTKLNIDEIKQGQDFVAVLNVSNKSNSKVENVALTQIVPSGWEIINTRFTAIGEQETDDSRFKDVRDDRVSFYFDLDRKGRKSASKTFRIRLNAAYLGKYYLPGTQAAAMYDNDYRVRNKGSWVEVIQ